MWRTLGPVWEEDEDGVEINGITEFIETGEIEEIKETNGTDEETCNAKACGDVGGDRFHDDNITIEMWQKEVEEYQALEEEWQLERFHALDLDREHGHPSSSPSCFI
jgi:hypothetical protein